MEPQSPQELVALMRQSTTKSMAPKQVNDLRRCYPVERQSSFEKLPLTRMAELSLRFIPRVRPLGFSSSKKAMPLCTTATLRAVQRLRISILLLRKRRDHSDSISGVRAIQRCRGILEDLDNGSDPLQMQEAQHQNTFYPEDLGGRQTLSMMEIPEGEFMMGSPEGEMDRSDDEGPQHWVKISRFYMSQTPITQTQWRIVAQWPFVNIELQGYPSYFEGEKRPVEEINWFEAIEFCDRLTQHTGRPYRLPTEAEWEYACRAGTTTPFYFGETITTDLANYRGTDWEKYNSSGSVSDHGDATMNTYTAATDCSGSV